MLTSSASQIHSVHPHGVLHHLMREFPSELQSWNQFPAVEKVPIYQCRFRLSRSQVPCEVFIGLELNCPCPLNLNRSMYSIVVVICLAAVAEVQAKWLAIIE